MIDFSSWQSVLSTIAGLLLVTCLMMGVRLLFMQTIQKRREQENRQINERLKTLISAYKTLGSSFTGQLEVRPTHLRDVRSQQEAQHESEIDEEDAVGLQDAIRLHRRMKGIERAFAKPHDVLVPDALHAHPLQDVLSNLMGAAFRHAWRHGACDGADRVECQGAGGQHAVAGELVAYGLAALS